MTARDYTKKLGKGVKGLRIAFSPALGYVEVDPEIAGAGRRQRSRLSRELGAKVEEIDPGFDDPAPCFRMLWWSGARALLGRLPEAEESAARSGPCRCRRAVDGDHASTIISMR